MCRKPACLFLNSTSASFIKLRSISSITFKCYFRKCLIPLMEGVGKVTDLNLIVLLSSSSFKLQFTTQLINRCKLKLKTGVCVPYLSHPHAITAAEFLPPPCHILAALLQSIQFWPIVGITSVKPIVNSWGSWQYMKNASRRAPLRWLVGSDTPLDCKHHTREQ